MIYNRCISIHTEYNQGYKWTYSGADFPTEAPPLYTPRDLNSMLNM